MQVEDKRVELEAVGEKRLQNLTERDPGAGEQRRGLQFLHIIKAPAVTPSSFEGGLVALRKKACVRVASRRRRMKEEEEEEGLFKGGG